MSQQDPFDDVVIVHEKAPEMVSLPKGTQIYPSVAGASTTNVQPNLAPAPLVSFVSQLNEPSLEAIRAIVREELQNVLKGDNNNGCTQGKTAQAECDNRS